MVSLFGLSIFVLICFDFGVVEKDILTKFVMDLGRKFVYFYGFFLSALGLVTRNLHKKYLLGLLGLKFNILLTILFYMVGMMFCLWVAVTCTDEI